jgi:peptidoglycan/LPS O-acetylase OafA/YrhL
MTTYRPVGQCQPLPAGSPVSAYRPELDGLRCLAFLAVFLGHLLLALSEHLARWVQHLAYAGTFGVDLFFALSGYLITSLLLREDAAYGSIRVLAFWTRRVLRIWPLYFLVLACAVLINGAGSYVALLSAATFTTNLTRVPLPDGYVNPGILWTIHVEEQFYAAWPLLLVSAPRRFCWSLALGLIALSVASRAWWFGTGGSLHGWTWTPARLDAIGVGALLAWASRAAPRAVVALGALLPAVAVASAALMLHYTDATWRVYPGGVLPAVLVPLAVALCCGAVVWSARAWTWLRWRPLTYLGRISYGLYMFHTTVIGVCVALLGSWGALVSALITVALAAASYRWFEAPFLRLKARFPHVVSPRALVFGRDEVLQAIVNRIVFAVTPCHFMHYNLVRIRKSLRVTPAMDAGISDHVWSAEEIARLDD